MEIKIKRIYETADNSDGVRILVDRIWPRGISKEKAKLDYWLKNVAPSKELRKEFNHEPEKFQTFKQKYIKELQDGEQNEELKKLKSIIQENQNITLLYAAKDEKHNQAVVLLEMLKDELR